MSIVDIERNDLPIDLRVKIERVMRDENLSWKETLDFLASKVVSPSTARKVRGVLFRSRGGFTPVLRNSPCKVRKTKGKQE